MKVSVTIRGLDQRLITQARLSAISAGETLGKWMNSAIESKLALERSDLPILLDGVAERTATEGVFKIPVGTVLVGNDYVIDGRHISAAGDKVGEEVVTYATPSTLKDLGYRIFWIR